MKKSRFTEEQIRSALKQGDAGQPVVDVCRQMKISEATYYNWKKRYGNLELLEVRELRQLRDETARLQRPVADLTHYFNLWDFERDGRLYERLGIRWFKRFVAQGDYWINRRRNTGPSFRIVKDLNSAIAWEARNRFNEFVHLCSLVIGLSITVWLYFRNEYAWLVAIVFVVIIWDIYPIMLQRYNRARIGRIRALMLRTQKT